MYSTKRKGASLYNIVPYTLPQLQKGKNWYIDFKAYDPIEQKMKRKRLFLFLTKRKILLLLLYNLSY